MFTVPTSTWPSWMMKAKGASIQFKSLWSISGKRFKVPSKNDCGFIAKYYNEGDTFTDNHYITMRDIMLAGF